MKLALLASLLAGCVASSEAASTEQAIQRSQPVQVVNTATDPAMVSIVPTSAIPVRDIDAGARHPFAATVAFTVSGGVLGTSAYLTTIPVGQRLVVESISAEINVPTGDTPFLSIGGTVDGVGSGHVFAPTKVISNQAGQDTYVLSGEARPLYLDGVANSSGPVVSMTHNQNISTNGSSVAVSITGHLVPILTATDGL